jgi:putative endonuclease
MDYTFVMAATKWFIYMVETESGRLYTGITTDLERRFREHCEGGRGAKFFRSDRARRLVWSKGVKDRSAASREEARLKKLNRAEKLALIQSSSSE